MAEAGSDIATERPKILTTEAVNASDVVITMGSGDACPSTPASGISTGMSRA
jgi:arsenate reductase (thioredoxin)